MDPCTQEGGRYPVPFYWWTNFAPKKDKSLRGNGGKGGAQPRTTCPDCWVPTTPEGRSAPPRGLDGVGPLQGRRAAALCSHGHTTRHNHNTQRAVVATSSPRPLEHKDTIVPSK